MRIARKTPWVGGKSQKVTGTRHGIVFLLHSENKIYKSRTLHTRGRAVQGRFSVVLGIRPQLALLPLGAGPRPAPASSSTQSPGVAWYQTEDTVRARG